VEDSSEACYIHEEYYAIRIPVLQMGRISPRGSFTVPIEVHHMYNLGNLDEALFIRGLTVAS